MNKQEINNTFSHSDAFLTFLNRISQLLAPYHLMACSWEEGVVCLYHRGCGSRFLVPVSQLGYINELTDEWMENYLPGRIYAVEVMESGQVFDR